MKPVRTRSAIINGSCKVQKRCIDGCPSFRPILSASQTPTCNLTKFLVHFWEPLVNQQIYSQLIIEIQVIYGELRQKIIFQ